MGFVNTILKSHSLEIARCRVRVGKELEYKYYFNPTNYVEEIITYKLNKKHIIHDTSNVLKEIQPENVTSKFKDLIN